MPTTTTATTATTALPPKEEVYEGEVVMEKPLIIKFIQKTARATILAARNTTQPVYSLKPIYNLKYKS